MAKEEVEEVTEYEEYADYFEDKTEKDKSGQVKFKSVNHHKRAEANEVESDGEIATYANYALEYFGHRCALSGEKFVAFDNPVERENNKSCKGCRNIQCGAYRRAYSCCHELCCRRKSWE